MKRVAAFACSVALCATAAMPGAAGATIGTPGAQTSGERLIPTLGNGGYQVSDYDVSFDYVPASTVMASSVTITASATQDLSRFSLDSVGQTISAVTVDGVGARFTVDPKTEKLVVSAPVGVRRGDTFTVKVTYSADRSLNPAPAYVHLPPGMDYPTKSWVETPDGFALMGQPDRAHLFFPGNDIPGDKATFTFRVTVPRDRQVVASGTLRATQPRGDRTTYVYRTAKEIPTNVVQVAVGKFATITQQGPHGLPIVSQIPSATGTFPVPAEMTKQYGITKENVLAHAAEAARRTPDQVRWLERVLGVPFPFEKYGVLGVLSMYDGVALETATQSTFSVLGLALPADLESATEVHELAHQYFGDAVSPASWDDMWLNEGHAEYYQNVYEAAQGRKSLDEAMKGLYGIDQTLRDQNGPPARLDNAASITMGTNGPGTLALYALRETVGEQTFAKIETTFLRTYRGKSAGTQDYIAIANTVAHRDLTPLLTSWLYDKKTPPMPGHPDWTTK
ncbi:M1 family metallopeptidase [Amycolatopsis sp. NPDC059027]|uniref:M1 family metallopeptidase n=1 Tax=Amycolatopsis sp. NPDC059027 TaxID=3346709 RepID=UPI00366B4D78